MKAVRLLLVALAVVAIASCTTFQLSGIQMTEDMPSMQPLGDFVTAVKVHEFIGTAGGANLLNLTATNMDDEIYDAIRREIQRRSGDAAINVTVQYQARFLDLLLNGITGGLYAPATAIISGTVVSYN